MKRIYGWMLGFLLLALTAQAATTPVLLRSQVTATDDLTTGSTIPSGALPVSDFGAVVILCDFTAVTDNATIVLCGWPGDNSTLRVPLKTFTVTATSDNGTGRYAGQAVTVGVVGFGYVWPYVTVAPAGGDNVTIRAMQSLTAGNVDQWSIATLTDIPLLRAAVDNNTDNVSGRLADLIDNATEIIARLGQATDNLTDLKAGLPIITANNGWTLRRDNITAVDAVTTIDNTSLIDLGAGANGVNIQLKDNVTGTVTVRVYAFDGTDNNTISLGDVNVTIIATTTQDGRYCGTIASFDTFGLRHIKTPQIIAAPGSDNISVATKPY